MPRDNIIMATGSVIYQGRQENMNKLIALP